MSFTEDIALNNGIIMNTGVLVANEALEKFQKTAELLSRNKVNKSNAFENRLIDEVDKIFKVLQVKSEDESWVNYSTVIDACGKIYGYCVDYLHDEAFKILGGVNRTADIEQGDEDKPPILHKKFTPGVNTLENNELLLNMKDFDKLKNPSNCLLSISKASDSALMSGLIINNANVNGVVELVIDGDDLIVGNENLPLQAEVNLEGIVNFSEFQLLDVEISDKIMEYEKMIDVKAPHFKQVWSNINEHFDESGKSDSNSFVEEELDKEIALRPSVGLEERILQEFSLDFIQNSDKMIFSRDFLASGVTSRPKKRKRKEMEKIELESEPICLLRVEDIEEIDESAVIGVVGVPGEEKKKMVYERSSLERGYSEKKLGRLFTRNGKFIGINAIEKVGDFYVHDPLCLDELVHDWKPVAEVKIQSKPDLNIKVLKDTIQQIIDFNPEGDFKQIVKVVHDDLKEKFVEKVSVSACFVTLLHLANEQSINLKQTDVANFSVQKKHR